MKNLEDIESWLYDHAEWLAGRAYTNKADNAEKCAEIIRKLIAKESGD
ncbi:MAG: hypothetical protein JKY81_01555 [Colwellia sp.]|nr:hypothetical protein [Colwellia sp.]